MLEPRDLVYVPPRETHVLENVSDTEPAEYVVARDSPLEDAVIVPWAEAPDREPARLAATPLAGRARASIVVPVVEHDHAAVHEDLGRRAWARSGAPPCSASPPRRWSAPARSTCTTPVNAGRPVAGSSRWCAARPSASDPAAARRSRSSPRPPPASVERVQDRRRRTGSPRAPRGPARSAPPSRMSPPQSTTNASWPASSAASSSANTPLAMPPGSIRTPGGPGDRAVPAIGPRSRRQSGSCARAAGARAVAPARSAPSAASPGPSKWRRSRLARSRSTSVGSTSPPVAAAAPSAASTHAAHHRGDGHGLARVLVQPASARCPARTGENCPCHRAAGGVPSASAAAASAGAGRRPRSPCTREPKQANRSRCSIDVWTVALMTGSWSRCSRRCRSRSIGRARARAGARARTGGP